MASSIGGYDYDFITDVPEDLVCALCYFAFKNPVQIEECGHIYCKDCYQQMKDHAENSGEELLCPLDREKIDVTRVFKDKSDERRVLNLMVKCQNFGDKCDWAGELRDVLDHERNCCKNDTMFEQLIDRLTKLESLVKCHEQKHAEKDDQIKNLNKQMLAQNKQIEEQKKEIVNLNKNHNENRDSEETVDQHIQIIDNKKQIEDLQQCLTNNQPSLPLSMIIPNRRKQKDDRMRRDDDGPRRDDDFRRDDGPQRDYRPRRDDFIPDDSVPRRNDFRQDDSVPRRNDFRREDSVPRRDDFRREDSVPKRDDFRREDSVPRRNDFRCEDSVPRRNDFRRDESVPRRDDFRREDSVPRRDDFRREDSVPKRNDFRRDGAGPRRVDFRRNETQCDFRRNQRDQF